MGLLNSALQIGRSAILGYQGALQVVGNNISSASSPDYTRLSPQLESLQGNELTRGLQPGAGVALAGIQRHVDESLESRVRIAVSFYSNSATRQSGLAQVESLFTDVDGTGIGTRLRELFSAFDELQNSPEDGAIRDLVGAEATALAGAVRTARSRLIEIGAATDQRIESLVDSANGITGEIADLNRRITRAEAGGAGQATGLRDRRDAQLRRLSEMFDVASLTQENGAINVYLGSEALVQGDVQRQLTSTTDVDGEFVRTVVRFVDTGAETPPSGGQLEGLIRSRDEDAFARIDRLDAFAAAVIADINRVHADGQGLIGFRSIVGASQVLDGSASLASAEAGLQPAPSNGSFYLTVSDDASRTPVAYRIAVDFSDPNAATSLQSLVDEVNAAVVGVTASMTPDGRLSLVAASGVSFTFGHDGQQPRPDTSGVLAALGMNTFFTGGDSSDMAVNPVVVLEPRLAASSSSNFAGDGLNAARLASLDAAPSARLGGLSLLDYFQGVSTEVAVDAAFANDETESNDTVLSSLEAQRSSVSGVSLDEEAISLVKYERAFQGASRFIGVVDGMLSELMSLLR